MSDEPLDSMDPDVDDLLEAERGARAPAAELRRVWSRLGGAISPGAGDGDGGREAGHALRQWTSSRVVVAVTSSFLLGGGIGAVLHASLESAPPERVVYIDRREPPAPVPATTIRTAPPPEGSREMSTPELPGAAVSARAPPRLASSAASSSLGAERVALDQARDALGSGDAARALSLLDDHARRFLKPQLGEEREALAIQALVLLGRFGDARTRAERFRTAVPTSLFLPAVDASLASIP